MKLKAFAKINFSLRVFEKRPDGFHSLESIMQSVSLHDIVTVTPIASGIELSCDDPTIPINEQNTCYKAAKLYIEQVDSRESKMEHRGVRIQIEKRIPIAAGLAGGSADAAAVLFGLNRLSNHDYRLSTIELLDIAAHVGSDVPFCLTGGTCLVKGRGEIVEKLDAWAQQYYIIVNPGIHISAKWAYDEFDKLNIVAPEEIKNDLEPAVVSRYPIIMEIKEKLIELGCSQAQMSGSGSTVFGITRDHETAQHIYDQIKNKYGFCCIAQNMNQGIEVI